MEYAYTVLWLYNTFLNVLELDLSYQVQNSLRSIRKQDNQNLQWYNCLLETWI